MKSGALFEFWFVNTPPTSGDLLLYMSIAFLIALGIACGSALLFFHVTAYLTGFCKVSSLPKLAQALGMRIRQGVSGSKHAVQRQLFITPIAAIFGFWGLVSSSPTVADRVLSGPFALQLLAGKNFQLNCTNGMYGYGRFEHRGFAWAVYKFRTVQDDVPQQRAEAIVRANGDELCFKLKDFDLAGELCAPVSEKRSGTYRVGSADEWCEIKVKPQIARD